MAVLYHVIIFKAKTIAGIEFFKSDGLTTSVKIFDSGNTTFNGNVTVNGSTTNTNDLNVYGNLVLTGYLSAKPYVSLKVTTSGGTPSTNPSGSTLTLGTPGTVTLTHMGYNTTSVCTRGTPGNSN